METEREREAAAALQKCDVCQEWYDADKVLETDDGDLYCHACIWAAAREAGAF